MTHDCPPQKTKKMAMAMAGVSCFVTAVAVAVAVAVDDAVNVAGGEKNYRHQIDHRT